MTLQEKEIHSKKYIRDARSPIPKNEHVSRVMSANKAKETKPEIIFRKALWKANIRGYRKNWKKVPGRPDIAFPRQKLAIFINGCYWHNCEKCNFPLPKTNREFWKNKFKTNKRRDQIKLHTLEKIGWRTLVVWECDLAEDINEMVRRVGEMRNKLVKTEN